MAVRINQKCNKNSNTIVVIIIIIITKHPVYGLITGITRIKFH